MARFGVTRWGRAWIDAVEATGLRNPGDLTRGRTEARRGRIVDVELEPGLITATAGRHGEFRTALSMNGLPAEELQIVAEVLAGRAAFAAGLLSGQLLPELIGTAVGEALLPTAGQVITDCTCDEWEEPCRHAAGLCYVTAGLVDADPFVLFRLAGTDRASVEAAVQSLRRRPDQPDPSAGEALRARPESPARDATEAFASWRHATDAAFIGPGVPARPSRGNRLTVPPPVDSGVTLAGLDHLATDASRRAVAMLQGRARSSALGLTVEQDLARRAAEALAHDEPLEVLADRGEMSELELGRQALAWQRGGAAGLAVQAGTTPMSSVQEDLARAALGSRTRSSNGALQQGSRQLRVDDQGRWWRLDADADMGWLLAAGPFPDPADAL